MKIVIDCSRDYEVFCGFFRPLPGGRLARLAKAFCLQFFGGEVAASQWFAARVQKKSEEMRQ